MVGSDEAAAGAYLDLELLQAWLLTVQEEEKCALGSIPLVNNSVASAPVGGCIDVLSDGAAALIDCASETSGALDELCLSLPLSFGACRSSSSVGARPVGA